MNKNEQAKADENRNNRQNGAITAYWKSVRACIARPDGITEVVHATGYLERFDVSVRPFGLHRLRASERATAADVPKRGDMKTLTCHKIIAGPSVIRADGMWKIIYQDGITERFAATRE